MRPRAKDENNDDGERVVETRVKTTRKASVEDTDKGVKKSKPEKDQASESTRVANHQREPSSVDRNQPKAEVNWAKRDVVEVAKEATMDVTKSTYKTPTLARPQEDQLPNDYDPQSFEVNSVLSETKDNDTTVDCSDEDLYRGIDEIEEEKKERDKPQSGIQYLDSRVTVANSVDLLTYSEREWRGNTAKSVLIRKGYLEVSQRYQCLRRVRGDNYCALRATLFQILSLSHQLPTLLQSKDFPKDLLADKDVVGQWRFPFDNSEQMATGGAKAQLEVYMELLRDRWQAAVQAQSTTQREQLCQQVFQGQEEYGLLEALKFLMLHTATQLHGLMGKGAAGVPEFCWLLFARDSSSCPQTFLRNHLRHVGFTGGLEQVEMFLLGYSLEHTIQVFRLYKVDTEEFITYYPNDHRRDWPCISLVTEDDRHYNVPVA